MALSAPPREKETLPQPRDAKENEKLCDADATRNNSLTTR